MREDLDENAMLQRLRRACSRSKKTGKIFVDEKVHALWCDYATERTKRIALAKTLLACNENRAEFSKRVMKYHLFSEKKEHFVEEGWYSDDQLSQELGYSKYHA